MNFSLKAFIDILESYKEYEVMKVVMDAYKLPNNVLFNEKFIPMTEIMIIGRKGLVKFLYVLLETDEDFLESCLAELRYLTLTLKGGNE